MFAVQNIFGFDLSLEAPLFAGVVHDRDEPALMVDGVADGHVVRRRLDVTDLAVNLTRLKGRRCRGYYDLRIQQPFPCPSSVKLADGDNSQCGSCIRRTGFNAAFHNLPEEALSQQQRRYNGTAHAVYLAAFGEHLMKVGITSCDRLSTRLREQGALSAYRIAETTDAWAARRIEESISRGAFLRERISRKAKRDALRIGVSPEALDEALRRKCLELAERALIDSSALSTYIDDLRSNRRTALLGRDSFDYSTARPLAFSGLIKGAVGENLVIKLNTDRIVIVDSKELLGHRIGYSQHTPGAVGAVQTQLF
jgi:hypothetical protein